MMMSGHKLMRPVGWTYQGRFTWTGFSFSGTSPGHGNPDASSNAVGATPYHTFDNHPASPVGLTDVGRFWFALYIRPVTASGLYPGFDSVTWTAVQSGSGGAIYVMDEEQGSAQIVCTGGIGGTPYALSDTITVTAYKNTVMLDQLVFTIGH